jgi:hypothetical protein
MEDSKNNKNELTKEDLSNIIKTSEITIPAGLLYSFLQFTEIFVERGNIRANELTSLGVNYDFGTKIMNSLIESKKLEILGNCNIDKSAPVELSDEPKPVVNEKKKKNRVKF